MQYYWNLKDMVELIVCHTVQFIKLNVFVCLLHIPFVFTFVYVQYLHHDISSCFYSVVKSGVF